MHISSIGANYYNAQKNNNTPSFGMAVHVAPDLAQSIHDTYTDNGTFQNTVDKAISQKKEPLGAMKRVEREVGREVDGIRKEIDARFFSTNSVDVDVLIKGGMSTNNKPLLIADIYERGTNLQSPVFSRDGRQAYVSSVYQANRSYKENFKTLLKKLDDYVAKKGEYMQKDEQARIGTNISEIKDQTAQDIIQAGTKIANDRLGARINRLG